MTDNLQNIAIIALAAASLIQSRTIMRLAKHAYRRPVVHETWHETWPGEP